MLARTRARAKQAPLEGSAPVFAALGDETRLRLVSRLGTEGPLSVARLTAGTSVVGSAVADTGPASPPTSALAGLPLPDRTVGAGPATPAPRAAVLSRPRVVVVRPGDSLWTIAAHLLGPGADDTEVTAAWHRLHAANRSRVGDPDLIHPGQRLLVPELDARTRGEEHPR